MRRLTTLATLALAGPVLCLAAAVPAQAQAQDDETPPRRPDVRVLTRPDLQRFFLDLDQPVIGVTTRADSERGDTLGVLVEDVTEGSPAAEAGIKPGDRLQAINGTSLRARPGDAGMEDYAGVLSRRLQREITKVKEGESVELQVLTDGRTRTVTVTPRKRSEVTGEQGMFATRLRSNDRPVLGLSITATGTVRDTLGVFVQSVVPDGPAEKAGIIEGDRIAAINGVSVRVAPADAEDRAVGRARVERLQDEIAKLEAGESAELTVVTAGRSRTVRVTAVKASELPEDAMGMSIFRMPEAAALRLHDDEGELRHRLERESDHALRLRSWHVITL